MDWGVISRNLTFLMGGLGVTFQLAVFALGGGFALGIVLGLCRLSSRRWIYYPATVFINTLEKSLLHQNLVEELSGSLALGIFEEALIGTSFD
ncbi:unnamed protein product [marine sediment metagenome]|uniref:ABC transmembrane type-1 domain-containing protein n=1 Tax=marine sediment metagenome TaxID=412755 RepID=X1PW18_9ZZZZ